VRERKRERERERRARETDRESARERERASERASERGEKQAGGNVPRDGADAKGEEGVVMGKFIHFFTASASRRRWSRWCEVELSSAAVLSGSLASGRTVASESDFFFKF